jgi:hypothetical protein
MSCPRRKIQHEGRGLVYSGSVPNVFFCTKFHRAEYKNLKRLARYLGIPRVEKISRAALERELTMHFLLGGADRQPVPDSAP